MVYEIPGRSFPQTSDKQGLIHSALPCVTVPVLTCSTMVLRDGWRLGVAPENTVGQAEGGGVEVLGPDALRP